MILKSRRSLLMAALSSPFAFLFKRSMREELPEMVVEQFELPRHHSPPITYPVIPLVEPPNSPLPGQTFMAIWDSKEQAYRLLVDCGYSTIMPIRELREMYGIDNVGPDEKPLL